MAIHQIRLSLAGDEEFEPVGFRGAEAISTLFSYEVSFRSKKDVDPAEVLGATAEVTVAAPEGDERTFHGHVTQLVREDVDAAEGTFRFRATLVPWFALLQHGRDCRIFQEKSVVDILTEIAEELGFGGDLDVSGARGGQEPFEYCVQYRESDFQFLSRLLEEAGIFYFFRQEPGRHVMVLGDSPAAYADLSPKQLTFSTANLPSAHVQGWEHHYRFVSGKTTLRDHNPMTPSTLLEKSVDSVLPIDAAKFEAYDHPGRFTAMAGAESATQAVMEAAETGFSVSLGRANVRTLAVGGKFELDDTFGDAGALQSAKEFVVTALDHVATAQPADGNSGYACSFECIPAATAFRPSRSTPRATISGPQTATVTGPSGEEIHTDDDGRIKVQFHWDRVGEKDEKTTAFIRVAQPWAGAGFGAWFLPRIGDEVVVGFLDGDPDRPIVIGSVYHPERQGPYTPGSTPTVGGIRTHSTKEGGAENFNEIKFDDKKGEELFSIQAEKDRKTLVKADDTEEVGGKQVVTVKGDSERTVEGDNGESVTITKGGLAHTVSESGFVLFTKDTIQQVTDEGDFEIEVRKGSRTVTIKTDDTLTIADGGRTVTLDKGDDSLKISLGNQATKLDAGKSETEAMQSIELKVGQSSIKLEQSGITIKGLQVKIEGTVQTDVKGLILQLSADAMAKLKGGVTMIG